ncbi:MAG: EAL domain-containing protein [Marinobacterium sp.]|nr:EAL domain-containing protein [Marinobacterium sp.]
MSYNAQREQMVSEIYGQATESLERLSRNIAPYMEAYEVYEYEKQIATELRTKNHYSLSAIIVEDYMMSEITGDEPYLTGRIRNPESMSKDYEYDPNNKKYNDIIEESFYIKEGVVASPDGIELGKITIFVTDKLLKKRIKERLVDAVFSIVFLILLLAFLLFFLLKVLFINPLINLTRMINNRDENGIPRSRLPASRLKEVSTLSDTVNDMLDVIEKARDSVKKEHSRLENVIQGTRAGIWHWDINSNKVFFDTRWVDISGFSLTELPAPSVVTWLERVHPDDRVLAEQKLQAHLSGQSEYYESEARVRHKQGNWVWVLVRETITEWDALQQPLEMHGTYQDITSLKEYEYQLKRIAHYDSLTGLPNRLLLSDNLREAMSRTHQGGARLAILFLDLDGFKEINDSFGHDAGDQLLIALARRMNSLLKANGSLARLGGDEFIVILSNISSRECVARVAAELLEAVSEPVEVYQHQLAVSSSIGIALYPQAEEIDADQLIRQADQAMYQAKLSGKNCYNFFDAAHDRSMRGFNEALARLEEAIKNDEFELYYQPKVNLRTRQVTGMEALIRWNHPDKGLLAPGLFLPTIEGHPLMVELGEWTIKAALRQIESWQMSGIALSVSINISAIQLQQPNFVPHLTEVMLAHPQVKPEQIEFEVLETSALENMDLVRQVMKECHNIGISFAIDDFGTGYSTLAYLKQLPANVLKIDQSFVRNIMDEPEDQAIIKAITGLAEAFQKQVIAEGLEELEYSHLLLDAGCEIAQGYGIARPMPAHLVAGWLAEWSEQKGCTDVL